MGRMLSALRIVQPNTKMILFLKNSEYVTRCHKNYTTSGIQIHKATRVLCIGDAFKEDQ